MYPEDEQVFKRLLAMSGFQGLCVHFRGLLSAFEENAYAG